MRASATGRVTFRVGCPKRSHRCKVAFQLKRGRTAVSSKRTVVVRGGRTAKAKLRLRTSVRKRLSRHSRVKVSAVVVARDAAGHRSTQRLRVTLRAPRR